MAQLKNPISLKEAASLSGYHSDYISFLIREGKIRGEKIGRNWFTTRDEIKKYLHTQKYLEVSSVMFGKKAKMKMAIFAIIVVGVVMVWSQYYSVGVETSKANTVNVKTYLPDDVESSENIFQQ